MTRELPHELRVTEVLKRIQLKAVATRWSCHDVSFNP
jgi:hypothetical protein